MKMGRLNLLVLLICVNSLVVATLVPRVVQSFIEHEIVPDVLSTAPAGLLSVKFPTGAVVLEGNELTTSQVAGVPVLEWSFQPDRYYTLIFCDADAPSRVVPEARSFLHWLVVNIPGDDAGSGQTLTNIVNSCPEPESGLHRYLFLVYEQPGRIMFEEEFDDSFERRVNFSPEDFANKYGMGTAIAGNFYQTHNLEDANCH